METVEVVIRIPKNIYEDLFNKELQDWFIESEVKFYGLKIGKAIQSGTVLPKGHGRLIDADAINIHDVSPAYGMEVYGVTQDDIEYEPTVIEADKEKTGTWQIIEGLGYYTCSVCKCDSDVNSSYCPNCGAKMEGEELMEFDEGVSE